MHPPRIFSIASLICSTFLAAFLASCGDDSSSSKEGGETGKVKTVADLGTCLSAFEGDIYFVEEMDGDYTCTSGKWVPQPSIGTCTDSLAREGSVRREKNKGLDSYGTSFTCKDTSWNISTDVEAALKQACVKKNDGELADDSTGKKVKTYICTEKLWREATAAEKAAKALCTEDNNNSFAADSSDKKDITVYVCKDSLWLEALGMEKITRKVCTQSISGTFAADSSDKSLPLYVCDGNNWRVASPAEKATGKICDDAFDGKTLNFYTCKDSVWSEDTTSTLKKCTAKLEGEVAKEENPFRSFGLFETATDSSYVCDGEKWRKASPGESATGKLCTKKLDGDTINWYICNASINDWVAITESGLSECTAEIKDSVSTEPNPNMKKGDSLFVCNGSVWEILKGSLLGTCDAKLQDSVRTETNPNLKSFDSLFVCDKAKWENAEHYDIANGVACTENLNALVVKKKLCMDGNWQDATDEEIEMGAACTEATENVISKEKGKVCKSGTWEDATEAELATGKVCTEELAEASGIAVFDGYVCETSGWREATDGEKATGKVCTENFAAASGTIVFDGYVCETSGWRKATDGEMATGKTCTAALKDSLKNTVVNGYYCTNLKWNKADDKELTAGFWCSAATADSASNGYVCQSYKNIAGRTAYKFREETAREKFLGKLCIERNIDGYRVEKSDSVFICETAHADWKNLTTYFTDSRDGKKYRTIQIGDQVWMAENLNYAMTNSKDYRTWNDSTKIKCASAKFDDCKTYGRLYTISAAKEACPSGWHLPSYDEWETLISYVTHDDSSIDSAIASMLAQRNVYWDYVASLEPVSKMNKFYFSALPACPSRTVSSATNSATTPLRVGECAQFWTSLYEADYYTFAEITSSFVNYRGAVRFRYGNILASKADSDTLAIYGEPYEGKPSNTTIRSVRCIKD